MSEMNIADEAKAYIAAAEAEMSRLRAEVAAQQQEIECLRHAVGLMTTLKGSMEMRGNDPLGMMQEVHAHVTAEVARLEAALADMTAQRDAARAVALPYVVASIKTELPGFDAVRDLDRLIADQQRDAALGRTVRAMDADISAAADDDNGISAHSVLRRLESAIDATAPAGPTKEG